MNGKIISKLAIISLLFALPIIAAEKTQDELAKESVEKCKATATTKPTVKMILEKVIAGCKLVEKEGEKAFGKFKGKDSKFLFAGTYIWIHDTKDARMLMHPIKPKMEGMSLVHLKDKNRKMFFAEMNKIVKKKGDGWVDYVWPKPGEKKASPKISYVKLARHGEKNYVVGCGVYDLTMDDVKKALAKEK